jgi:hypothetical protein
VTATFTVAPPTCYALTLSHTGQGTDPAATPTSSAGCSAGQYLAGEIISLSASPDVGWYIGGWNGTDNDTSTADTNSLTMPAGAHSAGVNYVDTAPITLVCETFDSLTPGSRIGTYTGWYDNGSGPVVTAGNGVNGSTGLGSGSSIFNWTAHPFNWNAADFQSVIFQGDFQTNASGQFDDDRLSWTTTGTSDSSSNQFGVQLDHPNGGIVTYWLNGTTRINDVIVPLTAGSSGTPANTWYRFTAEITKLTATSAKIDVSLVMLDASGNPTGTPLTGSIADTSALASGRTPNASYFTATTMYPSYKNYTTAAAPADNVCYQVVTGVPPVQYALTVNASGSGSVTLNPSGGSYNSGTVVELTAIPDSGWAFSAWSGDVSSTDNPVNITMDGNKTVTATFTVAPPTCYALTLSHTGQGTDPAATPANSTGCSAGQYLAGEIISLSASPDVGWYVDGWNGTDDDTSTAGTNTLTMPAGDHSAAVDYVDTPPITLVCETFDSFTAGSRIGTYAGWFSDNNGPLVTAANGVAGSTGLGTGSAIFNWTDHPFNWNAADFQSIIFQGDFQTNGSGQFDDDRLSWTINGTNTSSNNQFGVQLDHPNGGIVTYWSNVMGGSKINDVIVPAAELGTQANTWYRFTAEITKLSATSARIDVNLVMLDASGNPTGTPITGSIVDTSALTSGHTPAAGYFTATTMYPSYKNYNAITGAADNVCYQVVTSP